MARKVALELSSVFNGNPITVDVWPDVVRGSDNGAEQTPSFHRVMLEVECGMSGGDYEVIRMFTPVLREEVSEANKVSFDVSSALRSFRDAYEYQAEPTSYPLVKFCVRAYDEYMINGELHLSAAVRFPQEKYLSTVFGGFSDYYRMSGDSSVQHFTSKPDSGVELVAVGETFVYAESYPQAYNLSTADLPQPVSHAVSVATEGAQTLGGRSVYALPAADAANRRVFRFINSLGVMESVSVPKTHAKSLQTNVAKFEVARRETFRNFMRRSVRKSAPVHTWTFTTDALDETWLLWYLNELLVSEHVWMQHGDKWLPCELSIDEELAYIDDTEREALRVTFDATFDLRGPIG